jgi:hypothetical protein
VLDPHQDVSRNRMGRAPLADVAIVIVGLMAAAVAGVLAFQSVGVDADASGTANIAVTTDPQTGRDLLNRFLQRPSGQDQYVVDVVTQQRGQVQLDVNVHGRRETVGLRFEDGKLAGVDRDSDGDGRADVSDDYLATPGLVKVGFSLYNDGVINAWAYRDRNGTTQKVEVSRRQDGAIDRWEYYENGQLARVEEDADRDGTVDRWLTYDAGILMSERTK